MSVSYFSGMSLKFTPPDVLILAQNAPKMRLAVRLCPDPLGELTVLPRPPNWIEGVLLLRGGEGRGWEMREGTGRGMCPILCPDLGDRLCTSHYVSFVPLSQLDSTQLLVILQQHRA